MTNDPEQMWQRFADVHGLDVNDAGRPFFVDGVMVGRAPADDAGEVAALRAEVARLRDDWEALELLVGPLTDQARRLEDEVDEARAEADKLRAEVERLQALGGQVQNARGDAETRAAEAKHTAESLSKAVADLATDLEKNRRGARSNGYSGAYNDGHHDARVEVGHQLRAILAADPVSLADVRGGREARRAPWVLPPDFETDNTDRDALVDLIIDARFGQWTQSTMLEAAQILADHIVARFLKAHDAEVAAAAWDEAVASGHLDENESRFWIAHAPNPYRATKGSR